MFESGENYHISAQLRFYCTNNMSEYEACILGLRLAVDMGIQELLVLGDSDLLVHQIQGEWETRDPKLIPYQHCLQGLCQRFVSIKFRHIPRMHMRLQMYWPLCLRCSNTLMTSISTLYTYKFVINMPIAT